MQEINAAALVTQPFLRGMPSPQLEALVKTATEVRFPARHRIFADGDYADKFWLIRSGYAALDVLVPGEGRLIIGRVGLGDLMGWSWLLPPYRWAFGAVSATEVTAFQFDAQAVRGLCAADRELRDELTSRLFRVVSGRLLDTRTRLITRLHDTSPYAAA
jgi:CRP-like cAMP-binding protein